MHIAAIRTIALLCVVVASRTIPCVAFVPQLDVSIRIGAPSTVGQQKISAPGNFDRRLTVMAVEPVSTSISSSLAATMSAFSKPSTALVTLSGIGATTPPVVYFLALVIAGFGIPISEDVLCIFAGTLLPALSASHKTRLILALYAGVVISDIITFSLGRMMRVGLLEPIRRRMNLGTNARNGANDAAAVQTPQRRGKRERVMQKLEQAGDYVGFVIRLSAGVRPAMMILAGFSGKVNYPKYALGTAMGAIVSLTVQLLLGYSMSHNPAVSLLHTVTPFMIAPTHHYARHCSRPRRTHQGSPLLDRHQSFLLLPPQTIAATSRALTSNNEITSSGSSSVPSSLVLRFSSSSGGDDNNNDDSNKDDLLQAFENKNIGDNPVIITRGDGDLGDDSIFEEIETGQPPQWMVMKEVC